MSGPVLDDPAQLSQAIAVFVLLLARMAPLALLVPWLSPRPGAPPVGMLLSVVLAAALWPTALATTAQLPGSGLTLAAFAMREGLLGAVYALSLALPLSALRWAGDFIDRARGTAPREPDPSILGELTLWLGVALFFAIGGHRVALELLADSLRAHPVGVFEPIADPGALALGSARLLAEAFAGALLVALPALIALLLAELAMGMALRLSGALPLMALLPGGRAALGLCVVWVSAAFVLYRLPGAFDQGLSAARNLWQAL